jgi:hypothetical protein
MATSLEILSHVGEVLFIQPALLPFFVGVATESNQNPRAIAVTKFRHLPYDTVGVIADKIDGVWRVTSIVSIVDH